MTSFNQSELLLKRVYDIGFRSAAEASHHHAKRMQNETSPYRNLRLGNFMEEESDEVIPERLRQYYLETYLNVCDTCESLTHCNPVSPIHRGMWTADVTDHEIDGRSPYPYILMPANQD